MKRPVAGRRMRRMSVRDWNEMAEAAHRRNDFGFNGAHALGPQQFVVSVVNKTDADMDERTAVGLDTVMVLPSDREAGFLAGLNFEAKLPEYPTHKFKSAILLDPIAAPAGGRDRAGRALVSGMVAVQMLVSESWHRYAAPKWGSGDIVSAPGGWPILYRESVGADRWAIIQVGVYQTEKITGYLTESLPRATVSSGELVPTAASMNIYQFRPNDPTDPESDWSWVDTEDSVDVTNVDESMEADPGTLIEAEWDGYCMRIDWASCSTTNLPGL